MLNLSKYGAGLVYSACRRPAEPVTKDHENPIYDFH